MSQLTPYQSVENLVVSLNKDFERVNKYQVSFEKESFFALNLLKNSDFLLRVAQGNPQSLQQALINISAIGVSLNPALKEAYLVPRGGQVCLDISYMGLVQLAIASGSVFWVQADIVRKNDTFEYLGMGIRPVHKFNPFGDRGEVVGAYCVAKLHSGDYLTTIMSKSEIDEIKNKSSQASKNGPWVTFYEEMCKKTCIKRASKLWPKSERVNEAVNILNEHEGIDFTNNSAYTPQAIKEITEEDFKKIRSQLASTNRTEEALLSFINSQFKTEIKSIEEMTPEMIEATNRAMGIK